MRSFLVDSDGGKVDNPLFLKKSLALLAMRQQRLAKRVKGSKRRRKARLLVAKTHERISNQRKDFLHKTANQYIRNYTTIFIEDLNIDGMVKNHSLARSIADSSWGLFFSLLTEKAEEAARQVIKVRPNGTSLLCSSCREKVSKSLSVRVHRCPFCGLVLDRDHNAALNIKAVGQTAQVLFA